VGQKGVDKRIDVIAMAVQTKATVFDLEQAELCYSPPFGSAKDPVNMVGFIAANALRGLTQPVHPDDVPESATLLDVRTVPEFDCGALPGALHVPLEELRERLDEIPRDRPVIAYCKVGLRGYLAERVLRQNGFAKPGNLSGGYTTWLQFEAAPSEPPKPGGKPAARGSASGLAPEG
jgi:rhodanese-related sulfurtransferase